MLRKRIIPVVLLDGFSVLKTIEFNQRRNLGSPITVARTYNTRTVDELILLDIDASNQKRAIDKFTIADVAKECFMPLTVGGGIRSIKDIRELLLRGADKVAINSYAIENPSTILLDVLGIPDFNEPLSIMLLRLYETVDCSKSVPKSKS